MRAPLPQGELTRADVATGLRSLETLRARMLGAASERDEARLIGKYRRIADAIAPYVEGKRAYRA
ncbi:MAG: hypothetical protein WD118_08790 [Phycisphaeraceae bacterium]